MSLNINYIKENFDAVLFDMDGTLVDSMWLWNKVDEVFLAGYGLDVPPTLKPAIEGMSYYQTAVYFKETFNLTESIDEIINIWDHMAHDMYRNDVPIKCGVCKFIEWLKENEIKTAICTSNSRFLTEAVMEKYPVLNSMDVIVTSDEIKEGKPSPLGYLTAAKELGVSPDKCLVFEDVPNGIMAGKNAGMCTCTLDDDFSARLIETKINLADYYIHDYEDLF